MASRRSFFVALDSDVRASTQIPVTPKEALFHVLGEFERSLMERSGLLRVKNKGDGLFIAGDSAEAVVNVALELRERFRTEVWADHGFSDPPGLRIGVDCGYGRVDGEGDDLDVVGGPADTASRIKGVAEPGEIWVSNAVREVLQDPANVAFHNLGERALHKDAGLKHLHAVSRPWEKVAASRVGAPEAAAVPPTADAHIGSAERTASSCAPGSDPNLPQVIDVDMSLLAHGPLAHVLVALAPRDMADISQDRSSEHALAAARTLLEGQNGHDPLVECYLEPPYIIQFPEFAFGSGDWDAVDTIVQGSTRPMVVIAGFGAVTGDRLLAWKNGSSATERFFLESHIGTMNVYNGQWVWVHDPHSRLTRCWCALKNFREQRHEVPLVTGVGRVLPAFKFHDLLLLPAICADLLYAGQPSTRERYRVLLEQENSLPVLIAGALYQLEPAAPAWIAAINDLVALAPDRVIVALANQAVDAPHPDEQQDRWRGLSGVFGRSDGRGDVIGTHFIRTIDQITFGGAVLRCPEPSILLGRIGFGPYGSRCGKYLWEVCHRHMLPATERPHEVPAVTYEVERLVRRRPPDVPTNSQTLGLKELARRLRTRRANAEAVAGFCLNGPGEVSPPEPCDPFGDDVKEKLVKALHRTSHLAGSGRMPWSEDGPGTLAYGKGTEVIVWCGKTSSEQKRRLEPLDWPGECSTLIVFGNKDQPTISGLAANRSDQSGAMSGALASGSAVPARPQVDFTRLGEGAEAGREQWDKPRNIRRAILMHDDDIDDACDMNTLEADDDLFKKIDYRLKDDAS